MRNAHAIDSPVAGSLKAALLHSTRALAVTACLGFASGHAFAASNAETCLAANQDLSLGAALPRVAEIIKSNRPLKIVAIGSSSTVGLWMLNPAATYPGVMQKELTRLVPNLRVQIINSGRNGDTIPGNVSRFERDVFAHAPDLVVWQLGSNDLTWGENAGGLQKKISEAVQTLRANGADVIMMDQQYTPVILATSYSKMQAAIAAVAQQDRVAFFPRFEMMHRAVDAGLSIGALVSFDGLHMSGDAYDCVGRALARAIVAASK